ncbi:MAG: 50S ribosomal protein L29 [Dehalococcoidia bacterium]
MSAETDTLRSTADADLRRELDEAHQALFNLRFQSATRQLADTSQIGRTRRRIARVRTLLREREILAELDRAIAAQGAAESEDGE